MSNQSSPSEVFKIPHLQAYFRQAPMETPKPQDFLTKSQAVTFLRRSQNQQLPVSGGVLQQNTEQSLSGSSGKRPNRIEIGSWRPKNAIVDAQGRLRYPVRVLSAELPKKLTLENSVGHNRMNPNQQAQFTPNTVAVPKVEGSGISSITSQPAPHNEVPQPTVIAAPVAPVGQQQNSHNSHGQDAPPIPPTNVDWNNISVRDALLLYPLHKTTILESVVKNNAQPQKPPPEKTCALNWPQCRSLDSLNLDNITIKDALLLLHPPHQRTPRNLGDGVSQQKQEVVKKIKVSSQRSLCYFATKAKLMQASSQKTNIPAFKKADNANVQDKKESEKSKSEYCPQQYMSTAPSFLKPVVPNSIPTVNNPNPLPNNALIVKSNVQKPANNNQEVTNCLKPVHKCKECGDNFKPMTQQLTNSIVQTKPKKTVRFSFSQPAASSQSFSSHPYIVPIAKPIKSILKKTGNSNDTEMCSDRSEDEKTKSQLPTSLLTHSTSLKLANNTFFNPVPLAANTQRPHPYAVPINNPIKFSSNKTVDASSGVLKSNGPVMQFNTNPSVPHPAPIIAQCQPHISISTPKALNLKLTGSYQRPHPYKVLNKHASSKKTLDGPLTNKPQPAVPNPNSIKSNKSVLKTIDKKPVIKNNKSLLVKNQAIHGAGTRKKAEPKKCTCKICIAEFDFETYYDFPELVQPSCRKKSYGRKFRGFYKSPPQKPGEPVQFSVAVSMDIFKFFLKKGTVSKEAISECAQNYTHLPFTDQQILEGITKLVNENFPNGVVTTY